MHKEIGVFVDESGTAASLYNPGKIVVYRKGQGRWKVIKEMEFSLDKSLGLKNLRIQMEEVIRVLDDCKIFVGLTLAGIPYFALEKADFSIWEFEGKPMDFLDYILEQEEKAELEKLVQKESMIIPFPKEISSGCYEINLKEIQANNSGITSKQVLIPFLRNGKFYSLEIICNHIPPWLESELATGGLKGESIRITNNEMKVVITKKCCYEC